MNLRMLSVILLSAWVQSNPLGGAAHDQLGGLSFDSLNPCGDIPVIFRNTRLKYAWSLKPT